MKQAYRILVLLTAVALASCFDDPGTDIVWGDEAYLEIDRAGQPNPSVQIINERKNDGTTYPFTVQVNIMGKPQAKDVVVSFQIDPTSTAIEGVHYTKVTAGNTITIPAGSNTAKLNFIQIADNIEADDKNLNLVIKLTGGDLPLSNYTKVTYTLQITCPSNLAETDEDGTAYQAHTDWIDDNGDAGSNDWVANIKVKRVGDAPTGAVVAGQYTIEDLSGGMEPIIWGSPKVPATFRDVCDQISLVSYTYSYAYFIDADASSVDPATGKITIVWSNFYGENGVTTLTPP